MCDFPWYIFSVYRVALNVLFELIGQPWLLFPLTIEPWLYEVR